MVDINFSLKLQSLETFLQGSDSRLHVQESRIVSIEDFTSLSHEIVEIGFPRIHNQEGYNLPHLYQWLYPIMSVEIRPYVKDVLDAWTEWKESSRISSHK